MRPLEAYEAVMQFAAKRGPGALRLALHAAVPQSFRPALLHLLRLNFVPEAGYDAEADVLFAPFTEDMGSGYFEFDREARRFLLDNLDRTYAQESTSRIRRTAGLLAAYVEQQSSTFVTQDRIFAGYLEIQRWVALGFSDPNAAAEQLAAAITKAAADGNLVARVQLSGLTDALSEPLVNHPKLLAYAGGLEALERGQADKAHDLLERFGDKEVLVGAVILPSPRKWMTKAERTPPAAAEPTPVPPVIELSPDAVALAFAKEDAVPVGALVRKIRADYGIPIEASPSLENEAEFQGQMREVRRVGGKLIVIRPETSAVQLRGIEVFIVPARNLRGNFQATVERLAEWLGVSDTPARKSRPTTMVYVSSTPDLQDYTGAALDAIQKLGDSSLRREQWPSSVGTETLRSIVTCDVFVGLYGEQSGQADPTSQKAYVELEFEEAERLGKYTLIFFCTPVRRATTAASPAAREQMVAFRKRLATARLVTIVGTPQELQKRLTRSLLSRGEERDIRGAAQAASAPSEASAFRYHAYISYQRSEATRLLVEPFVHDIRRALGLYVFNAQMFMDTDRFSSRQKFEQAITTAICQSMSFIAIITPAYFASEFAGREWAAFEVLERRRRQLAPDYSGILPVILRKSEPAPPNVARRQSIDLSQTFLRSNAGRQTKAYRMDVDRIARAIAGLLGRLEGVRPDCSDFKLPEKSAFQSDPSHPFPASE